MINEVVPISELLLGHLALKIDVLISITLHNVFDGVLEVVSGP